MVGVDEAHVLEAYDSISPLRADEAPEIQGQFAAWPPRLLLLLRFVPSDCDPPLIGSSCTLLLVESELLHPSQVCPRFQRNEALLAALHFDLSRLTGSLLVGVEEIFESVRLIVGPSSRIRPIVEHPSTHGSIGVEVRASSSGLQILVTVLQAVRSFDPVSHFLGVFTARVILNRLPRRG